MIDKVASILAETEQSILTTSVVCKTYFPPDKSSKELPAGILASFTTVTFSFVSVSEVSDSIFTVAVTADV